ncbi:hypothetical protein C2S52_015490 [Perilla frutescens var. hirtella]|nr:hypothetical protein C2S52_015490 [Perilla frutescens var. hirtella]
MAPVFGTVQMLKPEKSNFGLELRLIRCYENTNSYSMECIFHDREGTRVHVTIPRANVEKGNTITATLWENYADDMIEFLNSAPKAPVVIILQFCRPNVYRGEIRISSLFNVTKIVTKQSISELSDFCSSYLSTGKLRSTTISTLTSSSSRSLNDEIRDGKFVLKTISELMTDGEGPSYEGIPAAIEQLANRKAPFNVSVQSGHTTNYTCSFSVARISIDRKIILKVCGEYVVIEIGSSSSKYVVQSGSAEVITKTIQQILEDGQSGEFTVFATVNSIEDIIGVSYLACKVCQQELDPQDTLKFFCELCQSFDICGKSRYKLTVGVSDGMASTTFLLWKNQCMELLGENLAEDEMLDLLPPKVEGITTKKGLFKVIVLPKQVKNFMGSFSVAKVECEKSVVGATPQNQESSLKSKKGKEVIDEIADEKILIRDSLVTPKKTTNAVTILDDESVKRRLLDEFAATTQRRTKRIVKQEKM